MNISHEEKFLESLIQSLAKENIRIRNEHNNVARNKFRGCFYYQIRAKPYFIDDIHFELIIGTEKYDFREAGKLYFEFHVERPKEEKDKKDIIIGKIPRFVKSLYKYAVISKIRGKSGFSIEIPKDEDHKNALKIISDVMEITERCIIGEEEISTLATNSIEGVADSDIQQSTTSKYYQRQEFESEFYEAVKIASSSSPEVRADRLRSAPKKPKKISIITHAFIRNPDVVAEVLRVANGYCAQCKKPAPFNRKSDSTPYLEVHHKIKLADDGEDTVENSEALCPNCHREKHYGNRF